MRKIDGLRNIEILGETPSFFSWLSEKIPKIGDLIILYAKDLADLDLMVSARESFYGLKKILVVADPAGADDRKYHLLKPRYIIPLINLKKRLGLAKREYDKTAKVAVVKLFYRRYGLLFRCSQSDVSRGC